MRRRFIALQTCLALVLALYMAPFQHVHLGHLGHLGHLEADDDHDDDHHSHEHGHDHEGVVHSHALLLFEAVQEEQQTHLSDFDPPHHATSLDTFATTLTAAASTVFLPEARVELAAPVLHFSPVEIIEACGHDPPALCFSSPRAPPV